MAKYDLLQKYKLHKAPEVQGAASWMEKRQGKRVNKSSPEALITNYFKRIKEVVEREDPLKKKEGILALKRLVFKLFITKQEDIPQSYWDSQVSILRDRGQLGDWDSSSDEDKQEDQRLNFEAAVSDQWSSLEEWVDYFISEDSLYMSDEVKYWIFRNIVQLSSYNKEKKSFPKRSKGTVKMFPHLNQEALAYVIDKINEKYPSTKKTDSTLDFTQVEKDLTDEEKREFLQFLKKDNFAMLYAWSNEQIKAIPEHLLLITEGEWVKYEQGSNHMPLVDSIRGKGTGWCTAGASTAEQQLKNGDFYVFYSNNEDGTPFYPRIAIRMEEDAIAEVRGIADRQNLDPYMNDVLKEKLPEFPDADLYLKKEKDMRILTDIYNRHQDKEELTSSDLTFIYELDSKIKGFGYRKDPRINEILDGRDLKQDISKATGFKPEEISTTTEEALTGGIKYHHGDIYLSGLTTAEGLVLPEHIDGHLSLDGLTTTEGLVLPKSIGDVLNLSSLTTADGLVLPKSVGGILNLNGLTTAEGLVLPESVGEELFLNGLTTAEGLVLPEGIDGSLYFNGLTTAEGLVLPESIGGSFSFNGLTTAKGLVLPESISGDLSMYCLTTVEGLVLPESIGGYFNLNGLTTAKGLVLPEIIGGDLNLNGLTTIEGLVLPENIGGNLSLRGLISTEGVYLPETFTGKIHLKYATVWIENGKQVMIM